MFAILQRMQCSWMYYSMSKCSRRRVCSWLRMGNFFLPVRVGLDEQRGWEWRDKMKRVAPCFCPQHSSSFSCSLGLCDAIEERRKERFLSVLFVHYTAIGIALFFFFPLSLSVSTIRLEDQSSMLSVVLGQWLSDFDLIRFRSAFLYDSSKLCVR